MVGRWLEARTMEVKGRGPEPTKAMLDGTWVQCRVRMVNSRRPSLR